MEWSEMQAIIQKTLRRMLIETDTGGDPSTEELAEECVKAIRWEMNKPQKIEIDLIKSIGWDGTKVK